MWSKVIAKINSLTQVQKTIIIAATATVILSCGIIIFFAATSSDSDTISTSHPSQSEDNSDDSITITENTPEISDTTQTNTSTTDSRPELMSTPTEKPESTATTQSTTQNTTSKPTTTTTTTPAPTPEDPICGGDKKTSQSCIVQKMYGTTYPSGHIFAYDIANYYHRILNHVTPNVTDEISLSGDYNGALKMITKDLRQNETDSVSVHFYAYMTKDGWQANWKVNIARLVKVDENGVKHYTVYSQFGKDRLSAEERQAITDRYIPAYTKEIRETQALYEQKYLTWYNSTK